MLKVTIRNMTKRTLRGLRVESMGGEMVIAELSSRGRVDLRFGCVAADCQEVFIVLAGMPRCSFHLSGSAGADADCDVVIRSIEGGAVQGWATVQTDFSSSGEPLATVGKLAGDGPAKARIWSDQSFLGDLRYSFNVLCEWNGVTYLIYLGIVLYLVLGGSVERLRDWARWVSGVLH